MTYSEQRNICASDYSIRELWHSSPKDC